MIPGGGGKDDADEFRHWAEGTSPPSTVASSSLAISHHLSPFPILNPPGDIPVTGKVIDEARNAGGEGTPAVGGSIAERRATRSGSNSTRLNAGRFPSTSSLPSPTSRLPYLTIPPGLSPATLLDSPVMLLNSLVQQVQLSPTTGTFPNLSTMDQNPVSVLDSDVTKENNVEDANDPSLAVNPHMDSDNSHTNGLGNKVSSASTEIMQHGGLVLDVLDQTEMQIPIVDDSHHGKLAKKECITDSVAHTETSVNGLDRSSFVDLRSHFSVGLEDPSHSDGQLHVEDLGSQLLLEGDTKELCPLAGVGNSSEDGYNWRKYGQKQVKGSEFPRSYYKCTHPNCHVKKIVERSHDGQITEIIYKGTHSHSKPKSCRRSAIGSAFSLNEMTERPEATESFVKVESGPICRNAQQQGLLKDKSAMDWRNDILDRTSSVSALTDISDPSTPLQGKHLNHLESADSPPELSCTLASDNEFEDDEDGVTQGSISLGDDGDDDEFESKRRKMDYTTDANFSSRAVREPRVVLQTASEVDILDDGYRWRKYGQKVVKGNPNPRSYYKCTNPGCSVRKHVERASHDLKSVITTYEGKHNHEVPAARSSSHGNSVSANMGSFSVAAQSSMTLPTASGITKPEPRIDDLVPDFEVNGYLNPASYLRNLTADMKLGVSPGYNMKFPALQLMPFTSFGMHIGHSETNSLVSLSRTASNVPGSIPLNMQVPANLVVTANLGFNPTKGVGIMQPYLAQQQIKEGDARLLRPKKREEG